jgi:hypothetical protein
VLAVDFNTAGLSRLAAEVAGPGVLEPFIADVSDAKQLCNRHDPLGRWRIHDRLTMRLRD